MTGDHEPLRTMTTEQMSEHGLPAGATGVTWDHTWTECADHVIGGMGSWDSSGPQSGQVRFDPVDCDMCTELARQA